MDSMTGQGAERNHLIKLRLNQQQLELIDRSVASGEATSRAALIRRSLKEFVVQNHEPSASGDQG